MGLRSAYAYGVLGSAYDYNMSVEVARELGKRVIYHAMTDRDAYSGSIINCKCVCKRESWCNNIDNLLWDCY